MIYLTSFRGVKINLPSRFIKLCRVSAGALPLMLAATGVCAQQPAPQVVASPAFEIKRYDLSGNTLLSIERLQSLIAPFTGPQRTLADVQRAQAAIEEAYRQLGYGTVQVTLPEQNITSGVIRFNVIQPRVGKVVLDGNKNFNNENIRLSLPTIKEGEIPNSHAVARNLQMTGEHPIKKTTILLRTAETPDIVDVNVKVDDDRPWRVVASLDNTGNSDTGYLRAGIGFQHTNLFNRDHTLSAQYITSPSHTNKVSIFGLGYNAPVYSLNSSFDFFAGYSDVNSGVVQGLFNVSGSGSIFGARWNYYLPKLGSVDQKLSLGVDYRAFRNEVTVGGVGLVPDITIRPISLTYTGTYRDSSSELRFNLGVSANMPGGNDGSAADFASSRANATDRYVIYRAGFSYQTTIGKDWQVRASANGQYTRDALVAGELFGLGGPDSLRGLLVRELSNDRGVGGQLELYTPELAALMRLPGGFRARVVGFYDFGQVWRNKALPGEITSKSVADVGLGLRLNYGKTLSVRFDVANVLSDIGTRQRGDNRISAGMALVF